MSRTHAQRLRDILAAVGATDRAEAVAQRHSDDPELADVSLAAIQFHVFTIGGAVKAMPTDLTRRRPEVPWSAIARMRDLIGHHYYKLDAEIVRATIGQPVDRLRAACEALLAEIEQVATVSFSVRELVRMFEEDELSIAPSY